MTTSENENVDTRCNATEGNDKEQMSCNDIYESVSTQMATDGKAYLLSNYAFSAETAMDELAKMIVIHDNPLSIVEHSDFRRYSDSLQPLFKVPCRATINTDIMKLYETKKGYALRCLEENESRIALTYDIWTTSNQKKGYMALTTHYIDANWKLQKWIISFIRVPSPHTTDALSQVMMKCFMDWNIDNKLSTLTLDNCSTNDVLVNKLLGTLTPSSLVLKGRLFHMRSCAHIINLIMQDGFSVIESAIKNVRDSVSFWSCSPKRVQDFRLVARQLGVVCERELLLDCKTRWDSVYIMLKVALKYKDVFICLSKKEKHYVSLPSEEEWRMAYEVCDKLKLFYRVAKTFSKTKYPTSNMFFPLICDMKVSIRSWQEAHNVVIRNMASNPRYKLKLINFFFSKIYGMDSKDEVLRIRSLCNDLYEEYKKKHDHNKGKGQSSTTYSDRRNKFSWELYLENMISEDDMSETTELDDYLAERLSPIEEGFDILMWWNCNGPTFPILRRIARDVLAIPISTVASETAFSMSRNKIPKQCSRLKSQTVGALMCSQSWLMKEFEDKIHGEPYGFFFERQNNKDLIRQLHTMRMLSDLETRMCCLENITCFDVSCEV